MSFFALNAQDQNLTYILEDMQGGWSIGNGCGQFGNEGYRICNTDAIELNGNTLEVMWVQLTVYSQITDFGIEKDVIELLASGQLMLACEISEEYQNESTIIIIDRGLSIPESELKTLKVYPNPASDHVFIKGKNLQSIRCYDSNGRLLFTVNKPSNLNKVYLFNFSDGLYHLVIRDILGGVENRKLIVKG